MKKTLLFLLIGSFITCNAQKTKAVSVDPAKAPEVKAKMEKAYPPKPAPAVNTAKTATAIGVKNSTAKSEGSATVSNVKPFLFLGTFALNFEDTPKKGSVNKGKIVYALDGVQAAVVPAFASMKDVTNMRAVMNMREKEMTMLTIDAKGRKNGLLMKMPKPVLTAKAAEKPPVIKKTGEIKMIQGYKCEKVIVTLADSNRIESWVTAEIPLNMAELISLMNAGFKGKSPFSTTNMSAIKGTALETTITRTDGSVMKLSVTEIKKIKPQASIFSDDGYTIKDARGLPMFGGQ